MTQGRPNLQEFAETLLALGRRARDLLVVTSDSRGSGQLTAFGQALPAQHIEVGIAEQNLVAVAAGLAFAGKIVFAVSPACFLTARALEQIKNDVAYSDHPVKLIGISAGVSYGALGTTHHSLHDFAALRAIHNLDIVAPADNFETRSAILAATTHPRPIYIRFGKKAMPHLHAANAQFEIGKAIILPRPGQTGDATGELAHVDVTFVAIGEPLGEAVAAAELLTAAGVSCRVISMHTLKPLDTTTLLAAARATRALITVEEHSVCGGLGEACAAALMQAGIALPFKIVGLPDEHLVTGSQGEIFRHYGLSPEGLAVTARELLEDLRGL